MTRLAVAFTAVAALALIPGGASMRSRAAAARPPVVSGYPYASRCPGAGRRDEVDRWQMYACNCTSYAAWALWANGQRTDWFVSGAMDAWNWPNVARRAHFAVDDDPAVGAVAVWPRVARPYGHVAYVTAVHRDGTFDVAEYNYPEAGANTFVFGRRTGLVASGAVFIHVPRRGVPTR